MKATPRACRTCGQPTSPGPRCPKCEQEFQHWRNRLPHRQAYRDPLYKAISTQGQVCKICGTNKDLTKHHVRAVVKGGTVFDGIEILCRTHNSSRGAKT